MKNLEICNSDLLKIGPLEIEIRHDKVLIYKNKKVLDNLEY